MKTKCLYGLGNQCSCQLFKPEANNSKLCQCGHSHIWHTSSEDLGETISFKQKSNTILASYQNRIHTQEKEILTLKERLDDKIHLENQNWLCLICKTEAREKLYLPCCHACFCNTCSIKWASDHKKCPVCREKIDAILDIHL